MNILSFDDTNNFTIKRDPNQGNLFNLFQKNIMVIPNIPLNIYVVPREYEMRMDRISNHIYGSPNYVEELMVLNDIINPYSVQEGQYIYFCDQSNLQYLYTTDDLLNNKEIARQQLISSSQNNKNIQNTNDKNLPLTIKPSNLNQVTVSADNTVQIINSFE